VSSQADLLRQIKSGNCTACHQLGTQGTREIPPELGTFETTEEAWDHRVRVGQAGAGMSASLDRLGRDRVLAMFADWTDRIAAGEVPPAPPRPQGRERDVVITIWDWADPKAYLHDLVSTDRRDPTVNADGPLYGVLEASADYLPVLDPVRHEASRVELTLRDPETPRASPATVRTPSPYWGDEPIWTSRANATQPDVRPPRPRLDHIRGRAAADSGLLQGRLEQSVGAALPARAVRSTPRRL
jgi:hypothetical protein